MNVPIKVFLVDDHEIFRNGLKQLINSEDDMEVIGEAGDGESALQDLATIVPDVIIMDIRMSGINGLEAGQAILKMRHESKIIFFSLYDSPDYVAKALDMQASGFILKDTSNKIFLNAIRTVYAGRFYFIGEVTDILVKKYLESQRGTLGRHPAPEAVSLSRREQEILQMISDDLTTKEVAELLNVSVRTVEAHRQNILRKFHTNNMDEVLQTLKN
ncbi:response regulator transcription factor [Sphingobacterium paludis]|uniref:LuxR family two component transcriptional regulator n=1 Tax=Sphingobacterium paludis TaxID=1476465 RepID=A0A4V3E2P2_9SPHI|nr:response regulator transcription factor [Sphingobacterium paludis]TDS17188.1 LuxR family two component transcriptional regulator [Sphingobacterium paludis]